MTIGKNVTVRVEPVLYSDWWSHISCWLNPHIIWNVNPVPFLHPQLLPRSPSLPPMSSTNAEGKNIAQVIPPQVAHHVPPSLSILECYWICWICETGETAILQTTCNQKIKHTLVALPLLYIVTICSIFFLLIRHTNHIIIANFHQSIPQKNDHRCSH